MKNKAYLALLAVMWLIVGTFPVLAAGLLEIETGRSQETITLHVKDLDGRKVFLLSSPDRLVVDLPTSAGVSGVTLPSSYDGHLIKAVRFGQFSPEVSRLVFDLKKKIKVHFNEDADEGPLVIDIKNASSDEKEDEKAAAEDEKEKALRESKAKELKDKADKAKADKEAKAKADKEEKEKAAKEAEEKAAKEKADKEAKLKADKEAKEKAAKDAEDKAAKEKADKEAKAKADQEAKDKAAKDAEEKAAKDKADKEAKAKADKDAKDAKDAKLKADKEAKAKADQEAKEKAAKDAEEKAKQAAALAAMEMQKKAEKEAVEKAEKEKAAKEKADKEKKKKARKKPLIVIDPGHGGVDPGTIGPDGAQEKDVVLGYARDLKAKLLATKRYDVMLTRGDDRFIMLRKRVAIARQAEASLFISLHADSAPELAARGLSVYTVSEKSSDQETEALANRENKADVLAGVDLSDERDDVAGILISLAQRETKNNSATLADMLVLKLDGKVTLLPNTHRFAGFAVLKAPDVPSVLVEIGFLSHPKEEKLIKSKAYRDKVTGGLAAGIDAYFRHQKAAGSQ